MSVFIQTSKWLGIPRNTTSHGEKLISTIGAGLGILAVTLVGRYFQSLGILSPIGSWTIVASMGASAVLLFAVPHGALSQPWALMGGHLVSALVGVGVAHAFGVNSVSAALAVGLAVGAMVYLRCIHPPGGATALTAILGGNIVESLGYFYVLVPVALNVSVLLLMAIGFNFIFRWRRYPAYLYYKSTPIKSKAPAAYHREFELTQEDFSAAIQKHDSFVDITEEGLTELLESAKQHAEQNITHPSEILPGKHYSNGKLGRLWSVRQVVDATDASVLPSKDQVIYKVVAGHQSYDTGICLREEFRTWARFEVVQHKNRWVKGGKA